ncbi:hypothetical protein [Alloyangia mangrovi]|nr:hypothetical protein [Alloyangia mangrovi]
MPRLGPIADGGRKQNTAAGKTSSDGITALEEDMSAEWMNIQIMECEDVVGRAVTVFRQSDGTHQRYVLGNGRKVEANADGTFVIPETAMELRVMGV